MAMFEAALTDVIAIDADTDTVHFYTAPDNGRKDNHFTANCSCQNFGEEFIEKFGKVLKAYRQKNPMGMNKASLVLPDHLFLTDTVDIPAVGKKAMESSLEVSIGAIYKNKADLKYHTFPLAQNKCCLLSSLSSPLMNNCTWHHLPDEYPLRTFPASIPHYHILLWYAERYLQLL